ncbi:MAG: hypothetical protein ACPGPC_02970 [Alphaproteobacteria bacterium]
MQDLFATVMNENKNPLQSLPKIQRYQIMVILSLMWSTIFSVAIGSWYWWGELVIGHVAVATGVLFTGLTFRAARKKTHRDMYRATDGSARYDDIWGG